jgi:hypothetical protein
VNGRFIRIARRRVGGADETFRAHLIGVVSGVLNAYWDLSLAANDLQYKQRNRDVAAQFLADTRRQIAVGAAPALDRINAESAAAAAEQALVVARNSVAVRQNALKDYLSFRAVADDQLAAAQIVAIDPLNVPETDDLPSLHELIAARCGRRPEVALANLRWNWRASRPKAPPTAFCQAWEFPPQRAITARPAGPSPARRPRRTSWEEWATRWRRRFAAIFPMRARESPIPRRLATRRRRPITRSMC